VNKDGADQQQAGDVVLPDVLHHLQHLCSLGRRCVCDSKNGRYLEFCLRVQMHFNQVPDAAVELVTAFLDHQVESTPIELLERECVGLLVVDGHDGIG